jgi:hypothetical protein
VPLSACFDPRSDGAELQSVGISFVGAAAALAERARERPEGDAATQLGYLIGAMRRGAGARTPRASIPSWCGGWSRS